MIYTPVQSTFEVASVGVSEHLQYLHSQIDMQNTLMLFKVAE